MSIKKIVIEFNDDNIDTLTSFDENERKIESIATDFEGMLLKGISNEELNKIINQIGDFKGDKDKLKLQINQDTFWGFWMGIFNQKRETSLDLRPKSCK